jgi:hypothetical protein
MVKGSRLQAIGAGMISIHDNQVYGCSSDFEAQRLTLHTFDENSPPEFTDVIFWKVVAHRFEHTLPSNILFDIVEVDVEKIVEDSAARFETSYGLCGWVLGASCERVRREKRVVFA